MLAEPYPVRRSVKARPQTFHSSDPAAISQIKNEAMAVTDGMLIISTIKWSKAVIVEQLLTAAHDRLVTIADNAPLVDAARLLLAGTDLVVVCGSRGAMVGVITKTDVVARISACQGAACTTAAASVMSPDVLSCAPRDLLKEVWSKMKARGLKNIPVGDADGRPLGVLTARDVLGFLLKDVEVEESLLRDYVMGVGYH